MHKIGKVLSFSCVILLFFLMYSDQLFAEKLSEKPVINIGLGLTPNTLKKGEVVLGMGLSTYGLSPFYWGITDKLTFHLEYYLFQEFCLNYRFTSKSVPMSLSLTYITASQLLGISYHIGILSSKKFGLYATASYYDIPIFLWYLSNSKLERRFEKTPFSYSVGIHLFLTDYMFLAYQIIPDETYGNTTVTSLEISMGESSNGIIKISLLEIPPIPYYNDGNDDGVYFPGISVLWRW